MPDHAQEAHWERLLRERDPELRVYVMGIGGAGLAPLAMVLQDMGIQVSGSELRHSDSTERLHERGIEIVIGQDPRHLQGLEIKQRPHVVLHSSAVAKSNPERMQAALMDLPRVTRSQFLPPLLTDRDVLAVAGTHGKSTTTAMLVQTMLRLGRNPGYIIGATSHQMKSGQAGTERLFIIEADEYDGMFLGLQPLGAIVTSVDWDHPDCYPTPEAMNLAFISFLDKVRLDGFVIYNGDCAFLQTWQVANENSGGRHISFGLASAGDWIVKPTVPNTAQGSLFNIVSNDGSEQFEVRLQTSGIFNQFNAVAAWLACREVGASQVDSLRMLEGFQSVQRRFEYRGCPSGVNLVDDYAHHPVALRLTLELARSQFPVGRLWAVFQPHTYSRTGAMLKSFSESFESADRVLIMATFAAREVPSDGKDGQQLQQALSHPAATYSACQDDAYTFLMRNLQTGDTVVVMGAGDCVKLTDRLLEGLSPALKGDTIAAAPADAFS